jgi:hypothetical protein
VRVALLHDESSTANSTHRRLSTSRTALSCVLITGGMSASGSLLRYDLSIIELGEQPLGIDLKAGSAWRDNGGTSRA